MGDGDLIAVTFGKQGGDVGKRQVGFVDMVAPKMGPVAVLERDGRRDVVVRMDVVEADGVWGVGIEGGNFWNSAKHTDVGNLLVLDAENVPKRATENLQKAKHGAREQRPVGEKRIWIGKKGKNPEPTENEIDENSDKVGPARE